MASPQDLSVGDEPLSEPIIGWRGGRDATPEPLVRNLMGDEALVAQHQKYPLGWTKTPERQIPPEERYAERVKRERTKQPGE